MQTAGADNQSPAAPDGGAKTRNGDASGTAQQAQTPTANDAATPATTPTDATTPSGPDHASVRSTDVAASSSSNAVSGSLNTGAAAKTDASGLPNFGLSASSAATSTAAATTASSGAASNSAPVPISGLAVAITARAQAGSNQFDIRLDPPELGRIDVRLEVDRDGQVTTHMTADRADTLELLQNQQPQLEQALQQAGLKTADNGLQFTLRDQSFSGQNNGSGSQSNNPAQLVVPDPDLPPVAAATAVYARGGLGGGVDIRV